MTSAMKVEREGAIAWIVLDRPKKLNAMTIASWTELGEHIRALNADLSVRCAIIAGEGRAFLAGHDIGEIKEHCDEIQSGRVGATQLREWQKALQETTRLIRLARFPFIAAVQGYAVGRVANWYSRAISSSPRTARSSAFRRSISAPPSPMAAPSSCRARSASPRPVSLPTPANSSAPRRPTGSAS